AAEQAAIAEANATEADLQRTNAEENARAEEQARADADRQADLARARALAASSIAIVDDDPELATLLAVQAISETPDGIEQPFEIINALWRAGSTNRLINTLPSEAQSFVALSQDGTRLAISEGHRIRLVTTDTGQDIWTYDEETVDLFHDVDIGPDGTVAVGVLDSDARTRRSDVAEVDDLPNRIVILDGDTGSVIHRLEYPECSDVQSPMWSPDGRYLAVASGLLDLLGGSSTGVTCEREGADYWLEVYDTDSWERAALLPVTGEPRPVWDDAGSLHALVGEAAAVSFDPGTFTPRTSPTVSGVGDVAPDGSSFVVAHPSPAGGPIFGVYRFGVGPGVPNDILHLGSDFPAVPGIEIVDDGSLAVIGTHGSHTLVYDLSTSEQLHRLATGAVFSTAFDPATRRLYTAGADAGVKVWDLRASTVGVGTTADLGSYAFVNGNSFVVGPGAVAMHTLDTAASQLAAVGDNPPVGQIELFSPDSGMVTATFPDGRFAEALANGRWVVTTIESENFLWDPVSDERVAILVCEVAEWVVFLGTGCVGENEPLLWSVRASTDGQRILAYGFEDIPATDYSGHFRMLDPDTGEELVRVDPGDPPSPDDPFAMLETGPLEFLSDEFAFGRIDAGATVAVDLGTGDVLYRGGWAYGVELSTDDGLIAIQDTPASITVRDTSSWQSVSRIDGGSRIRGQAFNADGSRFAVGGRDLLIVDTTTGQVVQQMALAGVSDIHWIDDETLLVGTSTGIFGTVSLSTDDFLATVRDGLRRTFTGDECVLYRIDPCPTLEELRGG
ncbi:MAG: WD40 repeat domain-containing protein, partial [Acidimicrobiia bacterium]|nr:WD40 repeat domain-containing protein [Acidimicrobiia bacterium]